MRAGPAIVESDSVLRDIYGALGRVEPKIDGTVRRIQTEIHGGPHGPERMEALG
jgi:hypothetical protein